jgi:DNA-binding transcriptional ArsR family regulator
MSPRPHELTANDAAPVFAALGDPVRLSLLSRLCDGHAQSIAQLTRSTDLSRQGVSKHLAVLERARIIASERVGRESRYVLRPTTLMQARAYLDRASAQWDDALARLKMLVEK